MVAMHINARAKKTQRNRRSTTAFGVEDGESGDASCVLAGDLAFFTSSFFLCEFISAQTLRCGNPSIGYGVVQRNTRERIAHINLT
jgi:hypothetical protein